MVDKMVGDEVIGIYLPGLTGSDYRQRVVAAGLELLRVTGHTNSAGPWLSIGVGVMFRSCRRRCTRKREVLSESRMREICLCRQNLRRLDWRRGRQLSVFSSRDPMNFCARLVAAARGGEMIVSEAVSHGQ
jgi:adenylate cyclase